jgi:nitrate/nitrite transporter NarK
MKNLLNSLSSGNWRALLACFLYFDTGFTVWVMFGPLAPFIHKDIAMSPAELGFLVAVPVLGAAILRVTLGNLYQAHDGRRVALLGIALSALPSVILLLLPSAPSYTLLLVLGVFLGVGGASFAVALPMAGSNYPPKVQGLVLGLAAAGNIGAVLDGFMFPGLAEHFGYCAILLGEGSGTQVGECTASFSQLLHYAGWPRRARARSAFGRFRRGQNRRVAASGTGCATGHRGIAEALPQRAGGRGYMGCDAGL